jgi:hypothetical protein
MRLPLVCADCMHTDISTANIVALTGVRDDNCYEVKCPNGHSAFVILQQQRFEILFQLGAYAMRDGYNREAISSFAASLERFYEFFIRAVLVERGETADNIQYAWKDVAASSERQLGAYVFLHLREASAAPKLLSQKNVTLRNDIIHKGKFPSRDDALSYGEEALGILRLGVRRVLDNYAEGARRLTIMQMQQAQENVPTGSSVATQSIGTIVSLTVSDPKHAAQSLEEAVASLPKWSAN